MDAELKLPKSLVSAKLGWISEENELFDKIPATTYVWLSVNLVLVKCGDFRNRSSTGQSSAECTYCIINVPQLSPGETRVRSGRGVQSRCGLWFSNGNSDFGSLIFWRPCLK